MHIYIIIYVTLYILYVYYIIYVYIIAIFHDSDCSQIRTCGQIGKMTEWPFIGAHVELQDATSLGSDMQALRKRSNKICRLPVSIFNSLQQRFNNVQRQGHQRCHASYLPTFGSASTESSSPSALAQVECQWNHRLAKSPLRIQIILQMERQLLFYICIAASFLHISIYAYAYTNITTCS